MNASVDIKVKLKPLLLYFFLNLLLLIFVLFISKMKLYSCVFHYLKFIN